MSGAAATVMLPTPRGTVLFAQVDIALPVGVTLAVRGLTTLCRIATHRGRRSNKSNARRSYGAIGGRQGRRNTRNLYPRSPSAPRYNFKRHFGLEFNNYFRSALTLRGVRSVFRQLDQAAHTGCPPGNALARARVGIPIDQPKWEKPSIFFTYR